ncbi:TerD family protein [Streptomyces sp. NPDC047968]|uniref:TerD family protein n=1 Tax=unclassified Streptomyces TaxID=2593676 RepID=UPI00341D06F2
MDIRLAKGANAPLPAGPCRVHLASAGAEIDVCAVLLGPDGRVRGDEDLVFFNHPAEGGVKLEDRTITADLAAVPASVERIGVVAALDTAAGGVHRFDAASTPRASVECGEARITFEPPPLADGETAALVVELYRRAGTWKVRAVGQGWSTGLAGLATDFGVAVDDPGPDASPAAPPPAPPAITSAPSPAAPATTTARPPAPEPPAAAPPAAPPRPTGRPAAQPPAAAVPPASPAPIPPPAPPAPRHIVLTKAGSDTLSLHKDQPGAAVTATLEWDGGSARRRRAGADLDLYALSVPRHLVTERGKRPKATDLVVYYRSLGSLAGPPFIALDGDARTPGRETITITRPDLQGYVLLCAYSAVENGIGSFRSYGARVVVTERGGSSVTVPLFSTKALAYWVAIAMVDFTVEGGVRIEHVEQYSGRRVEARPTLYSNRKFRMGTGPVEFKTRPHGG